MKNTIFSGLIFLSLSALLISGCSDDGKVIEANNSGANSTGNAVSTGIFSGKTNAGAERKTYNVTAVEVLQASKYSYLKVEGEGAGLTESDAYWIATLKGDFVVGENYKYTGRLLKSNFDSKELSRSFDKIYLVSFIEKEIGGSPLNSTSEGVVSISEIVNSPFDFAGKTVRVHGLISKVNESIMDRNWIHIKDGSADDYDFVVTSEVSVPTGHSVTFEGVISTNKDFGAGYIYELLMEDAVPIQ
ncbi:MAG: hypothetical protein COA49_05845 [Bacteroidetes bacterium]|nr:MAG: hypothetical protein COA49_05845 [Bacteroidota bacterium]